jgi:hypothetical protein
MENKELTLRQRLDAIAAEGKEIKVTWEGGNDSGGYNLFIDGVEVYYGDAVYDEIVEDIISDAIDYGSWAGDYSADGSVYYNADQGAFIGEGKDTTSECACLDGISIEIRVPKYLNFDSVDMETEGTFCWGELNCTFRFGINNGPVFEEHSGIEKSMESYVLESINHILQTDEACKGQEIGWVSNTWSIPREEFEEEEDSLVFIIDSIDYNFYNTIFQSYRIPINEEK